MNAARIVGEMKRDIKAPKEMQKKPPERLLPKAFCRCCSCDPGKTDVIRWAKTGGKVHPDIVELMDLPNTLESHTYCKPCVDKFRQQSKSYVEACERVDKKILAEGIRK